MRRRWPLVIIVVVVGLLVVAWLFPVTVYVPVGLVKGEATFQGKPTDYWVDALNQEGFLGRSPPPGDIGKMLRQGGSAAVPVLSEIAQGPDMNLRLAALNALELMGAEAKGAEPILLTTVQKEADRSRFCIAADALANVDSTAAAEAMSAILREPQETLGRKNLALAALLRMAPRGVEAVPALQQMFNDTKADIFLRVLAAQVLVFMKQPADPLIPGLSEMVTDKDCPMGWRAVLVLGGMGPSGKAAVPTLLKLLDRPDLPVAGGQRANRLLVYRALGMIGPDASAAIPRMLGSLQTPNYFARRQSQAEYHIRSEVGLALARMGPAGKQAVAVRDAAWGATITLLAGGPPGNVLAPFLAEMERRVWIPRLKGNSTFDIEIAIFKVDPWAGPRAGLPTPVRPDADEADN